jgi:nuclear pore complex protein Nup205
MPTPTDIQVQDQWTNTFLRDACKLSWFAFYRSAMQFDPIAANTGIDLPTTDNFFHEPIAGEIFQHLRDWVLRIRRERGLEEDDEDIREASEDSLFKLAGRSDPRNDAFIFDQLQCLVDSLAGRKNFLKTLRNREEDALRSSKHHREEDIHAKLASRSTPAPLHYQAFMSFLAVVYRSLPEDRALHLWDDTTFTGIILDVRGNQYPGWAFWEMLTAISTGPECASISYNKMNNDTKLPWNKLFHFYQHFIDIMPKLLETVKPTRILSPAALHPDRDAIPLRGWTRLLTTVIRHSKLARDTLLTSKPNPVQVLFDFINTDVAVDPDQRRSLTDLLDLKANVYKALTAFVTRKGDVNDQEIIQRALENYERISFVDPTALFRSYEPTRISPVGWMAKMETLEQDAHIYPLTRAYIGFLTALIPSPNASLDLPRPTSARLANTLRRGQAYVMDRVLLVPTVRRFGREREQWEIINSALGFVEKALLAYDPSELVSADLAATQFAQKAKSLADEPGFTVLIRFIGERNVFAILANILDTTSSMPLPRPDIVTSTLQRVLRVYYRIFDLQELLSVQMQILSEPRAEASDFKRPIETCSLDQYLLNHLANVNSIALLVGDQDPTVSYISTKLVCHLANSAIFSQSDIFGSEYTSSINRLAGIIDASDDSLRIAQGFCTRLQGQGEDLTAATIQDVERDVLRGEISSSSIESLPIAIRSTILDLLVEGTSTEAHGPNIAHFILGFDFRTNDLPLQDPLSAECRPSALDSILTQLMEGSEAGGASTTSLFALHPVLAARSVRLVNQLFSNPLTGRSTISHALTHFGFSSNQLSSLPLHLPADNTDSTDKGIATTSHLGDYETSATNLTAFLEYRRWVLSCVALETFTFGGYSADAADIALTVFGASTEAEADELDQDEQRLTLNDLLASVDIAWKDNTSDTTRELEYFNSFSADKFKTAQWSYYDTTTMERELRVQKRQYEQRGAVVPGNTTLAIESEIKYILDKVHAVNRETEIAWAKGEFLSAWNECLKVSLSMLFRYVPEERQEVVLFELLDSLLDRCDADSASGILENLSEAVLVSITTLINILLEFDGQNLPVDRLSLILRKILDAVTRPGTTETSRGNLFASISQYLQLLTSNFDISDDASTVMTAKDTSPMKALQRATLREFSTKKDRFIPILCRDAMDDRDVWKTECFALLGAVVSICQSERDRAVLLPLTQMGALRLFVRDLKDREIPLQGCLEPEAGKLALPASWNKLICLANLHAYWVYEAKMAFLMSVAASKKGAEDLLDAGVFEQLSMCSFVSVQPMREEIMGESHSDAGRMVLIW